MQSRYLFALALGLLLGCVAQALDERGRAVRQWVALRKRLKGRA